MQTIAASWGSSASDLGQAVAPTGLGLSCQTSAAAVSAAHVEVMAFTAGLAARVAHHAAGVVLTDASYLAQEAESTATVAAAFGP